MNRFFVSLYRYFEQHRALMYGLLVASAAVFAFFGVKVRYEENILALVSAADSDAEMQIVFGEIKVKDKIFIQFLPRDAETDAETLAGYVDEFMEAVETADTAARDIDNTLYRIGDEVLMEALDYALEHIPSFVAPERYAEFDRRMTPEAAEAAMSANAELLMNDYTGRVSMRVSMDPFGLWNVLLPQTAGGAGFTVIAGHLMAKDSSAAYAYVAPSFPYADSGRSTRLVRLIRSEAKAFEARHPDVEILLHGLPVRSVGNSATIKRDIFLTVGVSLVIILIFILFCFRDWRVLPYQILPVLYGTAFALACIWLIQGSMSLLALGIGAIVLGVALSYCLHVITHHRYVGDPEKVLQDESTPVVLGCLTTIGAFLGLLFTSSGLLRDFGVFASLALTGSTLCVLVFLPHFMGKGAVRKNARAFAAIDRIDSVQIDRKPLLLAVVALLTLVCLFFAPRVQFDSDLNHIGYISPEERRASSLYNEKNSGGFSAKYFAAVSPDLDSALATTRHIQAALDSLQRAGRVRSCSGAVSQLFAGREEQEARIRAWEQYWTPDRVAQARHTLSAAALRHGIDPDFFEPFFTMVERHYEPSSLYDAEVLPRSILCNFIEQADDGRYLVFSTANAADEDYAAVAEAVSAIPHALVIDSMFYTGGLVKRVHDDFNVTLWISSLFVLIVLLVSFRNLWIALLAFLPMFLSWYVVQGVMAIFGLPFNLINIVISAFIFGIGVDYSIFVMQGLLAEARTGDSSLLLSHRAAIFFSAAVLVVVVSSLLFARHPALVSVGISTLIGMAATILYTCTLQPFLFRLLRKKAPPHPGGSSQSRSASESPETLSQ